MPFRVGQESGRKGWYVYVDRPFGVFLNRKSRIDAVPAVLELALRTPSRASGRPDLGHWPLLPPGTGRRPERTLPVHPAAFAEG